ncbi:C40 family peptidase [Undibacterium sp. FT137W]|uniref:C40 family peptidase n=2 Tax=Undibacterium fentianense TaxID=2828728 RepID=A0A941DY44_9BURK|nr:C40 family peptidase [Undibacterium fentianense]
MLCSCHYSLAAEESKPETSKTLTALKEFRDRTSDLTINAMSLLGIKYKRGGNTPENGLDCSGFVRLVFKNSNETGLPRTAKEISDKGDKIESKELKPGDLVFFNTLKKSFSHVGIYLGDSKFIHAPSAGGKVRIESLNVAYWKKRFNGARRINDEETKN